MGAESRIESVPERYRVDDLLLDVDACALMRRDTPIALPPRTFELFVELVRRYPRVVRRDELLDTLWRGEDVLDEALSQRVMLLRRALGDTAERPRYIALVRKWGYKLVAPVERLAPEGPATPPAADPGRAGVAVLPFLDLSENRDREYLCEGLAEEIINALANTQGLRVIARTSSFAVGRMGLDVREAGGRLGVGAVLEGSVRCEGQTLRVVAQLVSAIDGSHMWSERYDRQLTDVLALEDEIATAVAAGLGRRLRAGRSPSRPDLEAYTLLLEGRHHFAKGTPEALWQAKACFEKAVRRDEGFVEAYDGLAEFYYLLGFWGVLAPREAFELALWNALRVVELDASRGEPHALVGMAMKGLHYDWPEVRRQFARARELSPESPVVRLRYALCGLMPFGRLSQATTELEFVLATDPLAPWVRFWLGMMRFLARDYGGAQREADRILELDACQPMGHLVRAMSLEMGGNARDAIAAFERAVACSGGMPVMVGHLAAALASAGRAEEARTLRTRLQDLSRTQYVPPSAIGRISLCLGDLDDAFEWFERAVDARDPMIIPIRSTPHADRMRSDPRFEGLLRKMNLDDASVAATGAV